MPNYSYRCQVCGKEFEKSIVLNADHDHVSCPEGHKLVHRVYTAPRINFKGSGFYVTDNKKKRAAHTSR